LTASPLDDLARVCRQYYRAEGDIACLRAERAAVKAELDEVEAFVNSEESYRSQGVARYAPVVGRAGSISDPTSRVAGQHGRDTADDRARARSLAAQVQGLDRRIVAAESPIMPMRLIVTRLPRVDRLIMEMRFDRAYRAPSLEEIGQQVGLTERTVCRRLRALAVAIPALLEEVGERLRRVRSEEQ
jgi:hypothetical protein